MTLTMFSSAVFVGLAVGISLYLSYRRWMPICRYAEQYAGGKWQVVEARWECQEGSPEPTALSVWIARVDKGGVCGGEAHPLRIPASHPSFRNLQRCGLGRLTKLRISRSFGWWPVCDPISEYAAEAFLFFEPTH